MTSNIINRCTPKNKDMTLTLPQKIKLRVKFFSQYQKYRKIKSGEKLNEINFSRDNNTCNVFGNGPSLLSDIQNINSLEKDFLAVNHFAESKYFAQFKPSKYVLIDSYFWEQNTHPEFKNKRAALFNALKSASWPIQLFVPYFANQQFIIDQIDNPIIEVISIRALPVAKADLKNMPLALHEKKLGPPACNVLIYAVYIAILSGYEEINLYGADYSFHKDVCVDQSNNQLYMEYKHFYGDPVKKPLMINPDRLKPFTMTLLFSDLHLSFYAHELLNKFANERGTKIINRSHFSMIDSYTRY